MIEKTILKGRKHVTDSALQIIELFTHNHFEVTTHLFFFPGDEVFIGSLSLLRERAADWLANHCSSSRRYCFRHCLSKF